MSNYRKAIIIKKKYFVFYFMTKINKINALNKDKRNIKINKKYMFQ